jgi:CRISPR-associated endoribonuclease Cas6
MRIYLKIKSNNQIVPFNHQHLLTGAIHKWLGWNKEHGEVSLYSFSRLENGRKANKGLCFEQGSAFFFSSANNDIIQTIIAGIQNDPEMFHGLKVEEIIIQEDPDFTEKDTFYIASPIFIKRKEGERIEHIIYSDQRANDCLKQTLLTKMEQAGLSDDTIDIKFKTDYPKAGTKLITYKNIKNRTNWCPVIIKAKPETKAFAWNVGLGNSTGVGFGAVK